MACISFNDKIVTIWSNISYGIVTVLLLIHLIFCSYVSESQLNNLFDSFDSSPLFIFRLGNDNCETDESIVFMYGKEEQKLIGIKEIMNLKLYFLIKLI